MKHKYFPSSRMKKCCCGGEKKLWAHPSTIIANLVSKVGFLRYSRNHLYFIGDVKDVSEFSRVSPHGRSFIHCENGNSHTVVMLDGSSKIVASNYSGVVSPPANIAERFNITYPYVGSRYIGIGPDIYYCDESQTGIPTRCATDRGLQDYSNTYQWTWVSSTTIYSNYRAQLQNSLYQRLLGYGSRINSLLYVNSSITHEHEYATEGVSGNFTLFYHENSFASGGPSARLVGRYALIGQGANPQRAQLFYNGSHVDDFQLFDPTTVSNISQGYIFVKGGGAYLNGTALSRIRGNGKDFSIDADTVYAGRQFANATKVAINLAFLRSPWTYETGDDFELVTFDEPLVYKVTGNYVLFFDGSSPTQSNPPGGVLKYVYWQGQRVFDGGGVRRYCISGNPDMLVFTDYASTTTVIHRDEIVYDGAGLLVGFGGNNVAVYEGTQLTIFSGSDRIYERQHNIVSSFDIFGVTDTRLFLRVDDSVFIVDDEWGLLRFPIANIGIL